MMNQSTDATATTAATRYRYSSNTRMMTALLMMLMWMWMTFSLSSLSFVSVNVNAAISSSSISSLRNDMSYINSLRPSDNANTIHLYAAHIIVTEELKQATKSILKKNSHSNREHHHTLYSIHPHHDDVHDIDINPAAIHSVDIISQKSGKQFTLTLPHLTTHIDKNNKNDKKNHPHVLHRDSSSNHADDDTHNIYLLHLKSPIHTHTIDSINAAISPYQLDIHHSYIPHNTFRIVLPTSLASALRLHPSVLFICEYHSDWKIENTLYQHVWETNSIYEWLQSNIKLPHKYHNTDLHYHLNEYEQKSFHQYRNEDAIVHFNVQIVHPNVVENGVAIHTIDHQLDTVTRLAHEWQQYWHTELLSHTMTDTEQLPTFKAMTSSIIQLRMRIGDVNKMHPLSDESNTTVLQSMLSYLSSHPSVLWIEKRVSSYHTMNKYAKRVVQSGSKYKTPLYDIGVTGRNVLIGTGDTGIDYDSCFFYDEQEEVPVNKISHKHRKILTYVTVELKQSTAEHRVYAPPGDEEGHGTHTAGKLKKIHTA
jgi:hypothetical protein